MKLPRSCVRSFVARSVVRIRTKYVFPFVTGIPVNVLVHAPCAGRMRVQWLIDRADLVTDMREVKHYYTQGVVARKGIER